MIKKSFIIFAAVIFAFAMMGCPNDNGDTDPDPTPPTAVTVGGGASTGVAGGTVYPAFTATVEPAEAPQAVTWSVRPVTAGTIDGGVLTIAATQPVGTITVRATAYGTEIYGEATVTVTAAPPPQPTGVTVGGGATSWAAGGTVYPAFTAAVVPAEASQAVTWSVIPEDAGTMVGGVLTIAGTVAADTPITVRATATGTEIYGEATVTVTAPVTPATVTVTAAGGAETVERGDTLQFSAVVGPTGAPPAVTWSIYPAVTGAEISTTGLLTIAAAQPAGNITVRATAYGTAIYGEATVAVYVLDPDALVGVKQEIAQTDRDVIINGIDEAGFQVLTTGHQSAGSTRIVDGVNVVYNITGNQIGFRVLAPNIAELEVGDTLIVTGRTSAALTGGGLDLAPMNERHQHVARATPSEGPFIVSVMLTEALITNGVCLVHNHWGSNPRPPSWAFSLDDVIVYRPADPPVNLPLTGWILTTGTFERPIRWDGEVLTGTNLPGHQGLGVFNFGNWNGVDSASWVQHEGSLSLRVAAVGPAPNTFGIQIRRHDATVPAGVFVEGDILTVTGRVFAADVADDRAMVIVGAGGWGDTSNQVDIALLAGEWESFTLTLDVTAQHAGMTDPGPEIRVHNNQGGHVTAFYIDSITFYRP